MPQPFRMGIVGCGRIANAHTQTLLAYPNATLSALVDPVADRAHSLAGRFGISPIVATDVDRILSEVDGVIIATPNDTHASIAVRCLDRNVAVLIEKPLAVSTLEGEQICRSAEASGTCLAVGYVTRFRENIRLMSHLLRERTFGTVRRFGYQFGSRGGWAPVSGYNLNRAATGGGVLVVTGTHFLDRMLNWFGYPAAVGFKDDSNGGPEANAVATFRFDLDQGPLTGVARFSKSVALDAGFVLETDAGIVSLRDQSDAQVVLRPRSDPAIERVIVKRSTTGARAHGELLMQLEDFVESARTGRPPVVTGRQGLVSLRLIEELYRQRLPLDSAAEVAGTRVD